MSPGLGGLGFLGFSGFSAFWFYGSGFRVVARFTEHPAASSEQRAKMCFAVLHFVKILQHGISAAFVAP